MQQPKLNMHSPKTQVTVVGNHVEIETHLLIGELIVSIVGRLGPSLSTGLSSGVNAAVELCQGSSGHAAQVGISTTQLGLGADAVLAGPIKGVAEDALELGGAAAAGLLGLELLLQLLDRADHEHARDLAGREAAGQAGAAGLLGGVAAEAGVHEVVRAAGGAAGLVLLVGVADGGAADEGGDGGVGGLGKTDADAIGVGVASTGVLGD